MEDKFIPFIPLTRAEQQERATEIARKNCPRCPHDFGCKTDPKTGKSTHGCERCWIYLILNEMIGQQYFSDPQDGEEDPDVKS